ncbi:MAG: hypothetical protein OEO79_17010 [Gemmatimonadota bacterium]|nr:hypothetical protein [Gemmatimonadota bacterium]
MRRYIAVQVRHAVLLRAFDYLAAILFGGAAAMAAWLAIPASYPMASEMLLGMVVGIVAALPLLGFFSWLLGGFEILVLSMQVGMFAGMVGAMTTSTDLGDVAFEGALVGVMVQLLVHVVDRSLGGEVGSVALGTGGPDRTARGGPGQDESDDR